MGKTQRRQSVSSKERINVAVLTWLTNTMLYTFFFCLQCLVVVVEVKGYIALKYVRVYLPMIFFSFTSQILCILEVPY